MNEKKNLVDIKQNPLDLFNKWFEEAKLKEINDPNAMNLATVSNDSRPTSRIVLLKSFNVNGFVFYTNLNSKKGETIKNDTIKNVKWIILTSFVSIILGLLTFFTFINQSFIELNDFNFQILLVLEKVQLEQ